MLGLAEDLKRPPANCTIYLWLDCDPGARARVLRAVGRADSIQGRFEMVALHLVLALRRIAAEGPDAEPLGRALTEAFVVDLDDVMREMTFGDLAVPREVKRATAALFDRHSA